MDVYDRKTRSRVMRSVKSKDGKAELIVRKTLHAHGYRYRLHCKGLPGKPDIVFASRRKIILVHGCFWHQHQGCKYADRPATNKQYWDEKLDRNVSRDKETIAALQSDGWDVLVVWECEVGDKDSLMRSLRGFLSPD